MRMLASVCLAVCSVGSAQQLTPVPPPPTALPSNPFYITKTWIIGGVGNWDYLTVDPVANQLFIANGPTVQVVDVSTGTVAGIVKGMVEAHAIVLASDGAHGYVSDGPANMVHVFDRRSFQILASIPTGPSPRSMALDPVSGLLFVVGGQVTAGGSQSSSQQPNRQPRPAPRSSAAHSTLTVIDVEHRAQLAQILLPGVLGYAQSDQNGRIYITVSDRNRILRLDAQSVGSAVHRAIDTHPPDAYASKTPSSNTRQGGNPLVLDWSPDAQPAPPPDALPSTIRLDSNCQEPRALAFDAAHARLFAACSNFRLVVLNAVTSQTVAVLPIGLGPDAIGYDPNRGLIFSANGGGEGSLTIIRQSVTDSYDVIQTLPTRQHARTLAVNPSNGNVYLVTVIYGAALDTPPSNSTIRMHAIGSSFQVVVVGN